MKKTGYYALLCALLTAGLLIGCSDTEGTAETVKTDAITEAAIETTAETVDPDYVPDNLPAADFGGETVNLLTGLFYNAERFLYGAEETGDVVNDALYAARTRVEDRFHVNVGLTVEGEYYETTKNFSNMVLAGDNTYDLVYNHDLEMISAAMNGTFLNMREIDTFDFSKPWWTKTSEDFTVANKLYCTSSYFGIASVYMNFMLAVNKDLAAAYDLTVPYEKVRNGEWYFDDMIEMSRVTVKDLDGNGKMEEDDQYGFLSSYYGNMAMQSDFGGQVLGKDADGYFCKLDNSGKIVSILEKIEELYQYGSDDYSENTATYSMHMFVDGRGLFCLTEARVLVDQARDTDFAWGILPPPKFDENQAEYRSAGCDLYWGIALTAEGERAGMIATIIEALSCENYNNTLPVVWELMLGSKLSDAPDDADMFAVIRDAQYVDLGYAFSGQYAPMTQLVFLYEYTESGKAISYIEQRQKALDKFINETNTAYAQLP